MCQYNLETQLQSMDNDIKQATQYCTTRQESYMAWMELFGLKFTQKSIQKQMNPTINFTRLWMDIIV